VKRQETRSQRAFAMNRASTFLAALITCSLLLACAAAAAGAQPLWQVTAQTNTTIAPGGSGNYRVQVLNLGTSDADGASEPMVLTTELPGGLKATAVTKISGQKNGWSCPGTFFPASTVTCVNTTDVYPPKTYTTIFRVDVTASSAIPPDSVKVARFELSGGGATGQSTVVPVTVRAEPFGFGLGALDGSTSADPSGTPSTKAGIHPYDSSVSFELNTVADPAPYSGDIWPVEPLKDAFAELPPGLIGNPTVATQCTTDQLSGSIELTLCAPSSQIGVATVKLNGHGISFEPSGPRPVFNMVPPTGVPARFGFNVLGTAVLLDAKLRSDGDYGFTVADHNVPEGLPVAGTTVTLWGTPAAQVHEPERACPGQEIPVSGGPSCPSGLDEKPFLRNPTTCRTAESMRTTMTVDSWFHPGRLTATGEPDLSDPVWSSLSYLPHQAPAYPYPPKDWGAPVGIGECSSVPVKGSLAAVPTAQDAETPTGLGVNLEVPNPGMENKNGIASSDIKEVKVTLPEGVTINPSQAEGLAVCKPSQYASEEASFHPDPSHGCPSDSKIGNVLVHTQLLDEPMGGEVFVAQSDDPRTTQHGAENPFDSLLALYVVMKDPERGVLVKLAGEVQPDPATGRIVTTFRDLPQLPFENFEFRFREGARAPLVMPSTCGTYTTEAEITPWSDPDHPFVSRSPWQVLHGIGGGPCPPQGIPPFHPGFQAGAINPDAGSYSPFYMRLIRADGEQDMTKFSSVLPPGVSAKIAGVSQCPEAAIAAAKAKTGLEERENPSCPANSQIGRIVAGAGVGPVLTYVPGKMYLAGPYNGAPLSALVVTPAVAGPFDVGTVITREALSLNPRTAEVQVDGERSDPIPHILKGIPLKVRDLRVYVDRPDFTINPTSCDPSQVAATLFGSFRNVLDPADDVPVGLSSRFQAANCASLGFKPRLSLKLKGGTGRGGHPSLRAVVKPRAGDANMGDAIVTLAHSAFLDQAHIRTICTRVQYAARACPAGAVYGHVRAWTPLLDEPLAGPVYLRSSNHKLPDMVFALHGIVDIEAVGRIDSTHGAIRASFEGIPDAPISKVVLNMQGAKKGLIVNSTDLCAAPNRAKASFTGQNGRPYDFRPRLNPSDCQRASSSGGPKRSSAKTAG
jgi:hypothetical protein